MEERKDGAAANARRARPRQTRSATAPQAGARADPGGRDKVGAAARAAPRPPRFEYKPWRARAGGRTGGPPLDADRAKPPAARDRAGACVGRRGPSAPPVARDRQRAASGRDGGGTKWRGSPAAAAAGFGASPLWRRAACTLVVRCGNVCSSTQAPPLFARLSTVGAAKTAEQQRERRRKKKGGGRVNKLRTKMQQETKKEARKRRRKKNKRVARPCSPALHPPRPS